MTTRDDDSRDDDVPDLSPEDEQAVAALLASLPATPMPPEVLARIEAALAAEPALAATPGVTTLAGARAQRRPSRGPLVFRIAASAVAVVGLTALGIAFVNSGGSSSAGGSATGGDLAEGSASVAASVAGPALSSPTSGVRVTATGKTYTAADLLAQAAALLAGGSSSAPAAGSAAPTTSGKTVTPQADTAYRQATELAGNPNLLAACVKELTDGDGRTPLAVDTGRWDNQAALVVVLPADGASGQRQVFVVKPTCGKTDDSSDILQVAFLDK